MRKQLVDRLSNKITHIRSIFGILQICLSFPISMYFPDIEEEMTMSLLEVMIV
jgi:hypothetical protein